MRVREIESLIEEWAPPHTALPGDPIGHHIGDKDKFIDGVAVALDPTPAVVEEAHALGCGMLVVHHPLLFQPIQRLEPNGSAVEQATWKLVQHEMACFAAHTNWDGADGGVSDTLARTIGLGDIRRFGEDVDCPSVKIVTFVPPTELDALLDAMSAAGAGQIGLYRRCAFHTSGIGTYIPETGASPVIGEAGKLEATEELRVEMVAPVSRKDAVVAAILSAHTYDEPAYDVYPLETSERIGLGRIGDVHGSPSLGEFAEHVKQAIGHPARVYGDGSSTVRWAAAIGGAGSDWYPQARAAGADVLVTGEVRHHHGVQAPFEGIALIEASHQGTEEPGMRALAARLRDHYGATLRVEDL